MACCEAALAFGVGHQWWPAAGAAGMEVASRTPPLVAGLARAAAAGGSGIARTSLEMLSKLCLYNSQGYCLALQVHMGGLGSRLRCTSTHSWGTH